MTLDIMTFSLDIRRKELGQNNIEKMDIDNQNFIKNATPHSNI
jgi:hypothetical protein